MHVYLLRNNLLNFITPAIGSMNIFQVKGIIQYVRMLHILVESMHTFFPIVLVNSLFQNRILSLPIGGTALTIHILERIRYSVQHQRQKLRCTEIHFSCITVRSSCVFKFSVSRLKFVRGNEKCKNRNRIKILVRPKLRFYPHDLIPHPTARSQANPKSKVLSAKSPGFIFFVHRAE